MCLDRIDRIKDLFAISHDNSGLRSMTMAFVLSPICSMTVLADRSKSFGDNAEITIKS